MRSSEVCRTLAFLPLVGLALGVLFAPQAAAEDNGEFACTTDMFKGSYVWTRVGAKVTEDKISHPFTTVGVLRPDGQGKIPYFTRLRKDARQRVTFEQVNDETMGISTGFSQHWGEDPEETEGPLWRMGYSMEADCRGWLTLWRPNGQVSGSWRMILANGGRDGTLSGAGGGDGVWTGILRRIDNSDQELEEKVVVLEGLVKRMAAMMGVIRWRDIEE